MMASEARKLADKVNRESTNSQYHQVHNIIDNTAKLGKYECYYYEHIILEVAQELVNEGFSISESEYRNETTVRIKW